MAANDRQVGGDHYAKGGEQLWDRINRLELDYMQGTIVAYVERCWEKMGIEDLEKAAHYIEKYIELSRSKGRQGKQEMARVAVMKAPERSEQTLQSNWQYVFEGVKENVVSWTCRVCKAHFTTGVHDSIQEVHGNSCIKQQQK